ncbi:MAG: hypothetical protein ACWA5W_10285 [Phycisphaerales bacterium]
MCSQKKRQNHGLTQRGGRSQRIALGLIATAGIVSGACGQEYLLRLDGGPGEMDLSQGSMTITLDVIGDIFEHHGDEYMLWGGFGLETSGDAIVEDIQWVAEDWSEYNQDHGYLGNGIHGQIEFGQFQGDDWTPREGSEVGNRIGRFQITLAQQSISDGQFSVNLVRGERFSLSTINVDTGASYYSTPDSLELQGFTSNIVPSPGSSIMLLGMTGFSLARRRRSITG